MSASWDDDGRVSYEKPRPSMHGSSIVLLAMLSSVATTIGTVYVVDRFDLLPKTEVETPVPDLRGLLETDARSSAQAAGIVLIVAAREPSSEAKPGAVLRQSIPAGQKIPRNHPVNVVLAEALPKVPVVIGLAFADAKAQLEKAGYTLTLRGSVDAGVPEGQIVSQMPAADSGLEKGGAVSVQTSAGISEVEVPKLLGLPLKTATEAAEKLGLKVEARWVSLAETATGVVLNQKPPPGEKLKPGDKIEVSVNR